MQEIWKKTAVNPAYQVSNLGRVKNKRGAIKYIYKTPNGYSTVVFSDHLKQTTYNVEELVAAAFLPNPNNYTTLIHKDNNPANNRVDNLEWKTAEVKYNQTKTFAVKSRLCKPVSRYDLDGKYVDTFFSAVHAFEALQDDIHINLTSIRNSCKAERMAIGGYYWRYGENTANLFE